VITCHRSNVRALPDIHDLTPCLDSTNRATLIANALQHRGIRFFISERRILTNKE